MSTRKWQGKDTRTLGHLHDGSDELLKEAVDLQQRRPIVVDEVDQEPWVKAGLVGCDGMAGLYK